MARDDLNATVVNRIEVAPGLVVMHILPDMGVSDFEPGQYVAIGLPGSAPRPVGAPVELEPPAPDKLIKRSYSIGSPPSEKRYLEFYIAIVPTGGLTSRLALLQSGSRLWVAPKLTGTFITKDVPANNNLVLVSTGTGLAPYMSMLRTPSLWTPERKITVVHGVRFPHDLTYRDELEALTNQNGNFKYYPVVSRAADDWSGQRGYVQKLFESKSLTVTPDKDHVFLCGNPAMVEEVTKLLSGLGYTEHTRRAPGSLHLEKYW